MKKFALHAIFLVLAASVTARPITFDDMAAMKRVGAPQISPDGKWIAFDASTIDMPGNYRKSAIYLVPATGGEGCSRTARSICAYPVSST